MESQTININGETLSYLEVGNGDATLLFIHGAFINKQYWEDQIKHFCAMYRVIAIDLPGHGTSSANRSVWSNELFGQDIIALIDALSLKNVIIVGHSFGADVMLETHASNPSKIKGLIVIDHMKNVGTTLPSNVIERLVHSLNDDFDLTCEHYAKDALISAETPIALVNKLLCDFKSMDPDIGIPMLESSFTYTQREVKLLQQLKSRLYFLQVSYMPTDLNALRRYLSENFEILELSGTSHYPMVEHPEAFNLALEKVLISISSNA